MGETRRRLRREGAGAAEQPLRRGLPRAREGAGADHRREAAEKPPRRPGHPSGGRALPRPRGAPAGGRHRRRRRARLLVHRAGGRAARAARISSRGERVGDAAVHPRLPQHSHAPVPRDGAERGRPLSRQDRTCPRRPRARRRSRGPHSRLPAGDRRRALWGGPQAGAAGGRYAPGPLDRPPCLGEGPSRSAARARPPASAREDRRASADRWSGTRGEAPAPRDSRPRARRRRGAAGLGAIRRDTGRLRAGIVPRARVDPRPVLGGAVRHGAGRGHGGPRSDRRLRQWRHTRGGGGVRHPVHARRLGGARECASRGTAREGARRPARAGARAPGALLTHRRSRAPACRLRRARRAAAAGDTAGQDPPPLTALRARSHSTVCAIPSRTPIRASQPSSSRAFSTDGQRRCTST
jgi:hypothetical protein